MFRRRLMIKKDGDLPSEYQQVEYLEMDGGQMIKTGVQSNDFGFIVKAKMQSFSSAAYQTIAGRYDGNHNLHRYTNAYIAVGRGGSWYGNNLITSENYLNRIVEFETSTLQNMRIITETENLEKVNTLKCAAGEITLFGIVDYGQNFMGKCWYLQMLDHNRNLTRDFIPCYRKSDNKPGLYDIMNGVFNTNQGVREFIVGPDIN